LFISYFDWGHKKLMHGNTEIGVCCTVFFSLVQVNDLIWFNRPLAFFPTKHPLIIIILPYLYQQLHNPCRSVLFEPYFCCTYRQWMIIENFFYVNEEVVNLIYFETNIWYSVDLTHWSCKLSNFGIYLDGSWGDHVGWVPCHHGMVHPQVADGGKSSGYGG